MLPYPVNYVGAGDLNSGPCVHTDSMHLSAKLAARSLSPSQLPSFHGHLSLHWSFWGFSFYAVFTFRFSRDETLGCFSVLFPSFKHASGSWSFV